MRPTTSPLAVSPTASSAAIVAEIWLALAKELGESWARNLSAEGLLGAANAGGIKAAIDFVNKTHPRAALRGEDVIRPRGAEHTVRYCLSDDQLRIQIWSPKEEVLTAWISVVADDHDASLVHVIAHAEKGKRFLEGKHLETVLSIAHAWIGLLPAWTLGELVSVATEHTLPPSRV